MTSAARTARPKARSVGWAQLGSAKDGRACGRLRGAAVLRVLRYLGGLWSVLAAVASIVPPFIRDWVYDLVARHRHQIIHGDTSCLLPTPEQRARFIDWEATMNAASR